jgi:3-hydroxyacyl-CoA dehydrogenase
MLNIWGSNKRQGLGIALVAAQKAQVPVTLVDSNQASLDKGLKFAGNQSPSLNP